MLLIRRLLYVICLILSLVFISFYGGNLSYMLFFMLLINIIFSLLYILYVYFSIKIYQEITERRVAKQEFVPYRLILNNESLIAYRDVKINFMDQFSEIKIMDLSCFGLEPGSGQKISGELFCHYSGTYYVGVESIEIMDYFKILCIRFPMPQKLKVTVKPKVIDPKQMTLAGKETKSSSLWGREIQLPEHEVRKYQSGDNKNNIHWKNSAKRGELMVRNYAVEENPQFLILLNGNIGKRSFEEKIMTCDKLRETLLSITNYCHCAGYFVKIFLDSDEEKEVVSNRDFDHLYQRITDYDFSKESRIKQTAEEIDATYDCETPLIVITALGKSRYECRSDENGEAYESKFGRKITVLDVDLYETAEEIWRKMGNL